MTYKKNTPKAAVAKKATTPKEKKQTPPVVNQPLASTSAPSKPAPSMPVPPKPAPSKPSAKPTPTTPSAKSTVSKKIRVVVHLFFYVITTGVIVSGCYFAWQSWQQQNIRMQKTQAQIEEQSIWFAKAMSQQSLLLEKQKQQLDGFKAALNNDQKVLQHRLDAQAKRLDALSGGSRDSWMLEEARYLLRLANQRQLTGGGALGIIGLLESADTLLRDVDAADVFPLRDSLNKDILALKITPVIDREGIYLQLSAVLAQIDQLPPVPLASALDPSLFTTEMPATSEATLDDIVDSGWQEKMWSSIRGTFSHLDNYFRIQHHDEALQPLLSAAEQKAILHSMRLMLEQAQSALLREEEKIYQHS
jgi:uroporphyrin-3 C-methyltransferase